MSYEIHIHTYMYMDIVQTYQKDSGHRKNEFYIYIWYGRLPRVISQITCTEWVMENLYHDRKVTNYSQSDKFAGGNLWHMCVINWRPVISWLLCIWIGLSKNSNGIDWLFSFLGVTNGNWDTMKIKSNI